MEDKEVNITYETLFEILRLEKSREELQKLSETFFQDVIEYLKEKKDMLIQQSKNSDLTSFDEEKKGERQLINIRSFIKDIYEKREKKIINLALNKSKTNSSIIDNSALLPEEKIIFDESVKLLNKARKDILLKLLNSEMPDFKIEENKSIENKETKQSNTESKQEPEDKLIRFTHPVPKFVGPELEIYGPFEADDIAKLPTEIANVLINKLRAEEIKEE